MAGALIAANTMVFVAETAGLCDDGRLEEYVGPSSGPNNRHGETIYCVKGKKKRDIGVVALLIGWGGYGGAVGCVLWPLLLGFIYVLIRKR